MFTTYIKNLNDLVFPTSENPEEQPSTGVLGRIGSWLSPWRGKNPRSPSESLSPSDEPDLTLAGEEERSDDECGSARESVEQQKEEKSSSSSPGPSLLALSTEGSLSKEQSATQSSHRDGSGSAVCSAEAGVEEEEGAGPKGEDLVETRKRRTGQGWEREERSDDRGASQRGNLQKNASHVTSPFSFPKEGVLSESAHTQPPAKRKTESGKKIQVYLEESVIKCGRGTCTQQEVVRTKVEKNLQVRRAKSSSASGDSAGGTGGTGRNDTTPANGTESHRCVAGGASVRPNQENTQFQAESQKKQTEADSMGRKNTGRRKSKKSPQREAGSGQREKKPVHSEHLLKGSPSPEGSVSNVEGKSPKDSPVNSSSTPSSPTPHLSPGAEQGETSRPDAVKLDKLHNADATVRGAASAAQGTDGVVDMEDDDSLYKVERKTETPESKRRSLKVSRTEVKFYPKNLRLNPKKDDPDSNSTSSNVEEEGNSEAHREIKPKEPALKKIEEEQKPRAGRVADKISLFESSVRRVSSQTFPTPRSADGSPVRRATHKPSENLLQHEQRSRSAEHRKGTRSSSSSPVREKPLSVEDRRRNFQEASAGRDAKAALPPKSEMTGMFEERTSPATVTTSKTGGLDLLDATAQIQASATSGVSLKPEGPASAASEGSISICKEEAADTKSGDNVDLKATDQGGKLAGQVEISASEPNDSAELTESTRTQSKGPGSKEPTRPISPSGGIKAEFVKNQEQVDQASDPSPLPHNPPGSRPSESIVSERQQNVAGAPEKLEKRPDSSFTEDGTVKPVGPEEAEAHVNEDEPDTTAGSVRSKTPLDKGAVILPPKEETTGEQSLLFMQEAPPDPGKEKETPSSSESPALTQQVRKEGKPHVEHPQRDRDPSASSQQETEEKVNESNKEQDPKPMSRTEGKGLKSDWEGRRTQEKDGPQQILLSQKSGPEPDSVENVRGGQGNVAVADFQNKNFQQSQAATDKSEAEAASATAGSMPPPISVAQQQHHRDDAQNSKPDGGAVSQIPCDKKPLKAETNLPAHLPNVSLENSEAAAAAAATDSAATVGEPQPGFQTPDDSHAHVANDGRLSKAEPVTDAVQAVGGESAPAMTTQAHSVSDGGSFTGESTPISSPQPGSSERVEREGDDNGKNTSTVNSVPPLPTPSTRSSSENTQHPSDKTLRSAGASGTVPNAGAAGKTPNLHLPIINISPIVDKDVPKHPMRDTLKKEFPKAPSSPEAKKSPQRSSPRGLSRDDSAVPSDAPSSWLDVDLPVRKLKIAPRKLSYSGSESNLLDTSDDLDDEDFVERIKKLCAPFSAPLRKHNPVKPPQPTFAMPAIREDRFEKTFDPEEFTFGLRKSSKYTMDTTLSTLAKMQSLETKAGLRPARASLADRSILLSSLDTQSRLKSPDKEEGEAGEEKEERIKVKSRLEGSCILSGLTSALRSKKEALGSQVDGALTSTAGQTSPSEMKVPSSPPLPASQPLPPSPTAVVPAEASAAVKQGPAPGSGDQVPAAPPAVGDSCPPLPSFDEIKLPSVLEKYLNREAVKPAAGAQGQEALKTEVTPKKPPQSSGVEAGKVVKRGPSPPAPPSSPPGNTPSKHQTLTELRKPAARPQAVLSNHLKKRVAKGFHRRPGKLVLFENAAFTGPAHEITRDVADATSLQLSPLISVKVVRGCWLLYEKPGFQGRTVALEEGGMELSNMWKDAEEQQLEAQNDTPVLIGSIRLVVCDYSLPHIDLFTEPEGRGRVTPYHDDTVETGSFGIPLSTASIQVHSGVWLVFSDPGFQGMLAVLETGVYPYPESWGFPSPFIGSLRPLKMGVIKVENANEVKALVYENPGFEGSCLEIDADVFSFCESEAGFLAAGAHEDSNTLKSVGSLKVTGGLWVGYSEPGFEGQQHILEEGEYLDCRDWGGSEQLLSLQPVLSDFFTPHLKLFRDPGFGERGGNMDLTVPIINMEQTGHGVKTQSIDVIGGVWVVFEEPGFCGEPHILERGLYGCPEDWGALQPRVGSAMPVVLDDFESTGKFKVQLFSEPAFQGSVLGLEDSAASLQDGFSVGSCKVLAGSWLAFEGRDFTGRMCLLEAGSYADLRAMGCSRADASILSLQTTGFEFSLPSITLFERSGLRGKRVILTDGTVNLQLAGGCARVQSLLVEGGMWVLYEGINYRGAQLFLRPGEVPDWREFSTWQKIGSLRPLAQQQVHFRIRNRQSGLMMAVTGDLDDVKLMRVQEMEESGELEQIWFYHDGRLHCKLLEECFLTPSGSIVMAGSRVGLSPEAENHLWSITPEGFICYGSASNMVLDVKGGHHYDKSQVILNTMDPNKEQQLWDVELL